MAASTRWRRFDLLATSRAWLLAAAGLLTIAGCGGEGAGGGRCGTGSWRPGALEIHHLGLGQADATLIVSPEGRSLLVDVGEAHPASADGAMMVGAALERILGCRRLDTVLITHFHLDHVGAVGVGGLWHLVKAQGALVQSLVHRDLAGHGGEASPTLVAWREELRGVGPAGRFGGARVVKVGEAIDLGPTVQVWVVAADGRGLSSAGLRAGMLTGGAPPSENDYSVALTLRFGKLDYFLGGDLSGEHVIKGSVSYHDVETEAARHLGDVDVYRVNHHGSEHSSNATFLAQIDPEVAIVSAGAGNPHGHPHAAALARLQATAAVYRTTRGESLLLRSTDGDRYTVGGDPYRAEDPAIIDRDSDGYRREADPDDSRADRGPAPFGGCDPVFQPCALDRKPLPPPDAGCATQTNL